MRSRRCGRESRQVPLANQAKADSILSRVVHRPRSRGNDLPAGAMSLLETDKMDRQERRVRLKYLLDELDLTPLAKNAAYTLSGGEKRRLEITRALVTSPKLLLLDEPFSGIDPITVHEVQKIIRRLKDRGLGIFVTDHSVRELLKLIDRGDIIHIGQVLVEGTAEFLANDPKAREIYLGPDFNMLDMQHDVVT